MNILSDSLQKKKLMRILCSFNETAWGNRTKQKMYWASIRNYQINPFSLIVSKITISKLSLFLHIHTVCLITFEQFVCEQRHKYTLTQSTMTDSWWRWQHTPLTHYISKCPAFMITERHNAFYFTDTTRALTTSVVAFFNFALSIFMVN